MAKSPAGPPESVLIEELEKKAGRGELLYIGEEVKRIDSLDMVLGKPLFTADQAPKNSVYVKVVSSQYAHAKILSIETLEARSVPGVLDVLTHQDVPGVNMSSAILPDRPLFAHDKVRSVGDLVAAVIGETRGAAEDGAERVRVDYKPLEVVLDPIKALDPNSPKVHEQGNLVKHMKVRKGDVSKGFSESDLIVEGVYRTQFQEPAAMETIVGLAVPNKGGELTLIGSLQSPHIVRDSVARVLNIKSERISVIQAATGGAFGPKSDEMPVDVLSIAGLAAMRTGRPAVCYWDRRDTMLMETKRHASVIHHKTGVKSDGRLVSSEIKIYLDTGAYASLGVLVIIRATFHATGPYDIPNVKTDSYLVYTNHIPAGSMRGFGAPQAFFAAESHMDEIARKLGMDPVELRVINMLKPGRRTATNQLIDEGCGLPECLDAVVKASGFKRKWREYSKQNGALRRGIGLALLYHGNSLGPEGNDFAYINIVIDKSGRVKLGTGLTEYGTGSISGVAQVVASVLGAPLEYFEYERPNTKLHKPTGPTVASRVVTIGGRAAYEAAKRLRNRLNLVAADLLGCRPGEVAIVDGLVFKKGDRGRLIGWGELVREAYERGVKMSEEGYYKAPECRWDEETGQGNPYCQYTFGAVVAEVEVDTETGVYRVKSMYAAYDVGKAINPAGVKGQIEGGSIQGLGYGVMEELAYSKDGRLKNLNLASYVIPTSMDIPDVFEVFIIEKPGVLGPFGAKIIAEPPVVLPAPAIRNAILNAIGVSINSIPITPEKIALTLRQNE